jgi:hypothetical protein
LSLQGNPNSIDADSAQKVIAAVFRQAEYRRSLPRTVLQEIFDWIRALIRAMGAAIEAHPNLKWDLPVAALLVVSLILARVVHLRRMGQRPLQRARDNSEALDSRDPWLAAHSTARAGNYLEAAHMLYFAVLEAIERRDRIIVDSAKTVGDYVSDLRRSNSVTLALFRDFAKVYQPVVWGSRDCDLDRFEQLAGIASRLTGRSA